MFRYLLVLLPIILISCAEENPDLVNPPAPSETVRIRFFNYASDNLERKLGIDNVFTPSTQWMTLSPATMPPAADSVVLTTYLNNNLEYTDSTKLKLWRDARYIVFGLHKKDSDKPLDTLLSTITAFAPVNDTNNCYISLININYESPNALYSVVVGCPNGNAAFPPAPYMHKSVEREVPSGHYPVSIIKIDEQGQRQSLGLFDLDLDRLGDYLFVIMGDTPEHIVLINRRDDSPGAMETVRLIQSSLAKIRILNFSQSEISAKKAPDETFLNSLAAESISSYENVSACTSDYLDSIVVLTGGEFASYAQIPLVVNDKYSLLVFDTKDGYATKSIILKNLKNLKYPDRSAAVRVVNMAEDIEAFSMSLGARDDPKAQRGYIAGEQLSTDLNYGNVSEQTFVLEGRAPISIFSSTSPQRLLYSFIGEFKAGKNYLVVVSTVNGEVKVSIIEENDVNTGIEYLPEGEYAQFVNFQPHRDSVIVTVDNVLSNAKIYYSNSFATILPRGTITFHTQGKDLTFNTEKDYRDLLVVAGTEDEADIIHVHTIKMAYNSGMFNRRFINAAKDIPELTVYDNDVLQDSTIQPIVTDLPYGDFSDPQSVFLERKFSYFFFDKIGGELLTQINDISMSFGKNYTIIFGGDKTVISEDPLTYNYSIAIIQEY